MIRTGEAKEKQLVRVWNVNLSHSRYIRKGKCSRCGFCCLGGNKNEPCQFLKWESEIAVCAIYGNHPPECKSFPNAPPILTEKCGYYFIDTWEDRILRAREV